MIRKRLVKTGEVKVESLIKRNFSEEFMRKIYDIYMDDCMSIVEKTIRFDKIFTEEFGHRKDYRRIGEGTNRFVCLLDNHIIKVAYNYLAYIDNMNELAQAKDKPKYLAKAFETNGLILVSEYVTVMDNMEFLECQNEIKTILKVIEANIKGKDKSKNTYYILGDMGTSNKNYGNWGRRMNGEIVILDYGYLYEVAGRDWVNVAVCPVCGSDLEYLEDFSELKCVNDKCNTKVKYTTVRNNLGYSKIIENIKDNLDKGKYTKFDKDGSLVVDVMEEETYDDEPEEIFVMPDEIQNKLNVTTDKFIEITEYITNNRFMNVNKAFAVKEDLFMNKELYDEKLFPFLIGSVNIYAENVSKYKEDFEKLVEARWNEKYNELKKDKTNEIFSKEVDDFVDYIDEETEAMMEQNFNSMVKRVDNYSDDNVRKVTDLDDILGSVLDDCFSNLIKVDESEVIKEDTSSLSFDELIGMLDEEKENIEKEKEMQNKKVMTIDDKLKEAYDRLEDALTELLTNYYVMTNNFEDDYVEGDVYRTYVNGDIIDFDYSPRVNARNILGGYKVDEFAFPLYRHLLVKFDYDTDEADYEYEAIYNLDGKVEKPDDIYGRLENRSIVINQIMSRFEETVPQKNTFITNIGKELNDYYQVVDDYYEEQQNQEVEITYNDPEYYLSVLNKNSEISKLIRDAKDDLMDELHDEGYTMNDIKNDYRIVYDYDLESMMTNTELNMLNIIKETKFDINDNVKDIVLNKYYEEYKGILNDGMFDIFKYNGSTVKESGVSGNMRLIRPIIKAKLVPKDSLVDSYKPELFNRKTFKSLVIEQRYEIMFDKDNSEDESRLLDLKSKLNQRNVYYTIQNVNKYMVKVTNENLRYGMTEIEKEIIDKYNEMLGFIGIKDVDKSFKKGIFDVLDNEYKFNEETRRLMKDLVEFDLSEAYANRLMKINILEMSGTMTRVEYLKHIEG
jgi:hypothetical protein